MRAAGKLLWLLASCAWVASAAGETEPFSVSQELRIQCKDAKGQWGEFIHCTETGGELTFKFGEDTFVYCGWTLDTPEKFEFVKRVVQQEEAWQCRVPMSADDAFYVPLVIPLWGIVEAVHVHINYHMSFVFHQDKGKVVGAAVYPVRDRFQLGKVGSTLNLHGPVRWFERHSFQPVNKGSDEATSFFSSSSSASSSVSSAPSSVATHNVVGVVLFVIFLCASVAALVYEFHLRPKLIKKFLKAD